MTKSKLKILMCSEASFINSGFGIYAKELLSRLYSTNKYDIAEFASYGFVNDPRDRSISWKYYANGVKDTDPRHKEYSSRFDNQFGRWRFEKVLLDFKPDVVIDIRDYWMTAYQRTSPLRKYFHWILMPTVDSYPQQEEWIDTFLDANAVFTYSDWGAEVLAKQSSGKINYVGTASPGIDCNIFKPKNRNAIKKSFGLPEDSIIIGSVMRNQKRKLIPELFASFRKVLDRLESENETDIAKKIFLYLHTSYPDMGWDIPELIKQNRLSNKVLFTYRCKNCHLTTCSTFQGPQKVCQKCINKSSCFTSVTEGVDSDKLSDIYNLFDLYVQYSICEGFGMPQVEAGACGVPIATVNYSAMCDIVKNLNAYPIKIKSEFTELETKATRVYPDNDDLVQYILKFIKYPSPIINKMRHDTAELTHQQYNWDIITKKWEDYLDKLDQSGYRSEWSGGSYYNTNLKSTINNIPDNFSCVLSLLNTIQQPDSIGNQKILELLNCADYGFIQNGVTNISQYGINNIIEYIETYAQNNNHAKQANDSHNKFDDDFIQYANIKAKS